MPGMFGVFMWALKRNGCGLVKSACQCLGRLLSSTDRHLSVPSQQVLPLGASKGAGVEWLLAQLGVDPANVLALG